MRAALIPIILTVLAQRSPAADAPIEGASAGSVDPAAVTRLATETQASPAGKKWIEAFQKLPRPLEAGEAERFFSEMAAAAQADRPLWQTLFRLRVEAAADLKISAERLPAFILPSALAFSSSPEMASTSPTTRASAAMFLDAGGEAAKADLIYRTLASDDEMIRAMLGTHPNTQKYAADTARFTWTIRALSAAGRYPEAAAAYARFDRRLDWLLPKPVPFLIDWAETCRRAGAYKDAEAILRQGIHEYPGEPVFRNNLADLLLDSGVKIQEAHSLAQEAVAAEPSNKAFRSTLNKAIRSLRNP